MAIAPIVEQDAIVAALNTAFSVPVVEDDTTTTSYVNGEIAPYVFVDFGTPVATATGRSIVGEAKQPFNIRAIIGYVAGSRSAARAGASQVAGAMTGFVPNTNSGPMRLVGGGSYTLQDESTKPIKYISETFFVFVANLDVEP